MSVDIQTGRVVFIDDITEITPRRFLSYIHEGFVPVARTEASDVVSFAFASYKDVEGEYSVTVGATTYNSADLDTNYAA